MLLFCLSCLQNILNGFIYLHFLPVLSSTTLLAFAKGILGLKAGLKLITQHTLVDMLLVSELDRPSGFERSKSGKQKPHGERRVVSSHNWFLARYDCINRLFNLDRTEAELRLATRFEGAKLFFKYLIFITQHVSIYMLRIMGPEDFGISQKTESPGGLFSTPLLLFFWDTERDVLIN